MCHCNVCACVVQLTVANGGGFALCWWQWTVLCFGGSVSEQCCVLGTKGEWWGFRGRLVLGRTPQSFPPSTSHNLPLPQTRMKPNADIDIFKSEMCYFKWNTASVKVFYSSNGSVTSCAASLLCEFRGLLVKGRLTVESLPLLGVELILICVSLHLSHVWLPRVMHWCSLLCDSQNRCNVVMV